MEKRKRKKNKLLRTLYVLLAVFLFFAAADATLLLLNVAAERTAHVAPSYEKEDILSAAQNKNKTEEDYELLYRQTGLSKAGIDRLWNDCITMNEFVNQVLAFQAALFGEYDLEHEAVSPFTNRDIIKERGSSVQYTAPMVPVENGDILVSSTCHSFGWRHGHAALVIDAVTKTVLESVTLGVNSQFTTNGTRWFQRSSNFLLLRLKEEYRTLADPNEVALAASRNLYNVPYSLTVGIFSTKDQGTAPQSTHCSHLVWQAYRNFSIDIDSDGGLVVTSNDIARSPYFEVVQVFGFDPVALW